MRAVLLLDDFYGNAACHVARKARQFNRPINKHGGNDVLDKPAPIRSSRLRPAGRVTRRRIRRYRSGADGRDAACRHGRRRWSGSTASVLPIRNRAADPVRIAVAGPARRSWNSISSDTAGIERALRTAGRADASIEGFRPGMMERLGLGPEVALARNPAAGLRPHDRLGSGRPAGAGGRPRHQLHRAHRRDCTRSARRRSTGAAAQPGRRFRWRRAATSWSAWSAALLEARQSGNADRWSMPP